VRRGVQALPRVCCLHVTPATRRVLSQDCGLASSRARLHLRVLGLRGGGGECVFEGERARGRQREKGRVCKCVYVCIYMWLCVCTEGRALQSIAPQSFETMGRLR